MHGVCQRRPARRHGEFLDRRRGEVAVDLSLSHVRVQRCGKVAVLEHRERDGTLSTEPKAGPQEPALLISRDRFPSAQLLPAQNQTQRLQGPLFRPATSPGGSGLALSSETED